MKQEFDDQEYEKFVKDFSKVKANKIKKNDAYRKAISEYYVISKLCPHKEIEIVKEYTEGGYDYRSKTETIEKCLLCGNLNRIHTEYGGFN